MGTQSLLDHFPASTCVPGTAPDWTSDSALSRLPDGLSLILRSGPSAAPVPRASLTVESCSYWQNPAAGPDVTRTTRGQRGRHHRTKEVRTSSGADGTGRGPSVSPHARLLFLLRTAVNIVPYLLTTYYVPHITQHASEYGPSPPKQQ